MRKTDPVWIALFCVFLVVLGPSGARQLRAEEAPGTPASATGPPEELTEVIGEPAVDLRGVWMLVAHGYVAEERGRTNVEFYTVEKTEDEGLRFHMLPRKLPAAMQEALDHGNKVYNVWTPSPEQIDEIRRAVDRLPPDEETQFARHKVKVVGRDHFETTLTGEGPELAAGSDFALEISHDYRPRPLEPGERTAQLMRDTALYAVRRTEPARLEGDHSRVILAAGPVPIPIGFRGPFRMHRLRGPGEGPTLADRLTNAWHALLRGCR